MRWRLLRSALLGVAIGLALAALLGESSEGVNLTLTVGGVALLVVGMALRRWLLFRREIQERRENDPDSL